MTGLGWWWGGQGFRGGSRMKILQNPSRGLRNFGGNWLWLSQDFRTLGLDVMESHCPHISSLVWSDSTVSSKKCHKSDDPRTLWSCGRIPWLERWRPTRCSLGTHHVPGGTSVRGTRADHRGPTHCPSPRRSGNPVTWRSRKLDGQSSTHSTAWPPKSCLL